MTSIPMTGVEDGGNPGVRFFLTDEELISHYLAHKISGNENQVSAITEVDNICNHEPWDLPALAAIPSEDTWYFFSRGKTRVTSAGFWKVTGKSREIKNANNQVIGFKRLLIFYRGRVRNRERTNWVMHEFSPTPSTPMGSIMSSPACVGKLISSEAATTSMIKLQAVFRLC